jgi:hypothetical protein
MQKKNEKSQSTNIQEFKDMERLLFSLPLAWVLGVAFAAILSLFEVTLKPGGGIKVTIHVTTVTVILIALAWLPVLLKIFAVGGGRIKTPVGEASTEGLLSILLQSDAAMKREALPGVIGALNLAEQKKIPEAEMYRGLFEKELSRSITPDSELAQKELQVALEDYNRLRKLPFGPERTAKVSTVAALIRALSLRSKFKPEGISDILKKDPQTGMIVLLGLLKSEPDTRYFEIVLQEFNNPSGPQEQYLALVAFETMLPLLTSEQQKKLVESIKTQEYIIPQNEGRWTVSRKILARIHYM